MTKSQLNGIIRAIRQNYDLERPHATAQVLEHLMIDIANELETYSNTFLRHDFLKRCGHPQYQIRVAKETRP